MFTNVQKEKLSEKLSNRQDKTQQDATFPKLFKKIKLEDDQKQGSSKACLETHKENFKIPATVTDPFTLSDRVPKIVSLKAPLKPGSSKACSETQKENYYKMPASVTNPFTMSDRVPKIVSLKAPLKPGTGAIKKTNVLHRNITIRGNMKRLQENNKRPKDKIYAKKNKKQLADKKVETIPFDLSKLIVFGKSNDDLSKLDLSWYLPKNCCPNCYEKFVEKSIMDAAFHCKNCLRAICSKCVNGRIYIPLNMCDLCFDVTKNSRDDLEQMIKEMWS